MNRPRPTWRGIAARAAAEVGPVAGAAVLHVTDIHNSLSGFRFASALARALRPRLVALTGDLSGVGGPAEAAILRAFLQIPGPCVFAPGNHDSDVTNHVLRLRGAAVLDRPRLVTVAGIRVWGYPDPNRSPPGGPPYDPALCLGTAARVKAPVDEAPYVVAVHNSRMVAPVPPAAGLLLCGHRHTPAVERRGGAVLVRCGSTGGGGPFEGPLQAAVVDLRLPEHRPSRVWLLETNGRRVTVEEAPLPG